MPESREESLRDFYIGLILALLSTIFCGSSFIFKKLGLRKLAKQSSTRAGEGGFGYLKEWMWWAGMILMATGEVTNFAAYAFAPASLVTPLGALSVLVSTVSSSYILRERLNLLGKISCTTCLLGSTVMVIHAPVEQEISTMEELEKKLQDPGFLVYIAILLVTAIILIVGFAPRYGKRNVLVYIILCSILGVFNVMSCKGMGIAVKETFSGGKNQFENWVTWFLLTVVVISIITQMNYLNKALDIYNTSIVTSIYYVVFTSAVIISSLILFMEWRDMSPKDIIGQICGFLIICAAVFQLNGFKDLDVSWRNLAVVKKNTSLKTSSKNTNGHAFERLDDKRPLVNDRESLDEFEDGM